jgi:hypothetical protein
MLLDIDISSPMKIHLSRAADLLLRRNGADRPPRYLHFRASKALVIWTCSFAVFSVGNLSYPGEKAFVFCVFAVPD